MYKDEWGMVVNAPPASAAPRDTAPRDTAPRVHAPRDAAARGRDVLLPGETLLWEGAPRQGAGWRCLLRERDIILSFLAAVPGMALLVVMVPQHREFLALAVTVGTATGIFTLARLGHRLRRARYLVTDRRAIVVSGSTILSINHAASRPQRRATRCGTTIELGRGVTGNAAAARWDSDERLARLFSGPDKDAPVIAFRALEPSEAPFELLSRLAAAPLAHHGSPMTPLGGGFSA